MKKVTYFSFREKITASPAPRCARSKQGEQQETRTMAKSHAVFKPGLLSQDKQNQFSELQVSLAKLKVRRVANHKQQAGGGSPRGRRPQLGALAKDITRGTGARTGSARGQVLVKGFLLFSLGGIHLSLSRDVSQSNVHLASWLLSNRPRLFLHTHFLSSCSSTGPP